MGIEEYDYTDLLERMKKYRYSQNKLAEAIPMSRTALNLKLNNKSLFTQWEIKAIVNLLEIPTPKIGKYFFKEKVRKNVRKIS